MKMLEGRIWLGRGIQNSLIIERFSSQMLIPFTIAMITGKKREVMV